MNVGSILTRFLRNVSGTRIRPRIRVPEAWHSPHATPIVHLIGMHLPGVHLPGVHLPGVHLPGVHITGMHLIGVHFSDVFLTDILF